MNYSFQYKNIIDYLIKNYLKKIEIHSLEKYNFDYYIEIYYYLYKDKAYYFDLN